MPERAKSIGEIFNSYSARDSGIRLLTSGVAWSAVEFVSWRTSHSFRELIISGIIFGIEPVRQAITYYFLDSLESPRPEKPRKSWLQQLEDNIFDSPRR